jgi:hypothetical protein
MTEAQQDSTPLVLGRKSRKLAACKLHHFDKWRSCGNKRKAQSVGGTTDCNNPAWLPGGSYPLLLEGVFFIERFQFSSRLHNFRARMERRKHRPLLN